MIEQLGPIISLYELIINGLKSVYDKDKVKKKKEVQIKIIKIQLLLEEIIDNAQEILSIIKRNRDNKKFSKKEIDRLRGLLYSQRRRLRLLLDHIHDDTSEEIMKLFTPDIRRRIIDLVHIKGGAIEHLIYDLDIFDYKTFDRLYTDPMIDVYDWDHTKFMKEGRSYIRQTTRAKKKISIFERMPEQDKIVSDLGECSKELSDFIRSQINIEDIELYKENK